jgi:L-fuconolactonase
MKIVDAQVHIWGANTPERPWPARAEPHRAPLGKEELLAEMDKAGVDGVVIVPPS